MHSIDETCRVYTGETSQDRANKRIYETVVNDVQISSKKMLRGDLTRRKELRHKT